jgi:hypothetical protein
MPGTNARYQCQVPMPGTRGSGRAFFRARASSARVGGGSTQVWVLGYHRPRRQAVVPSWFWNGAVLNSGPNSVRETGRKEKKGK